MSDKYANLDAKDWVDQLSRLNMENHEDLFDFLNTIQKKTVGLREKQWDYSRRLNNKEKDSAELKKILEGATMEEDEASSCILHVIMLVLHIFYYIPEKSAVMMASRILDSLEDGSLSSLIEHYVDLYLVIYSCLDHESNTDCRKFEYANQDYLSEVEDELQEIFQEDLDKDRIDVAAGSHTKQLS